jgi:hypothetical protein
MITRATTVRVVVAAATLAAASAHAIPFGPDLTTAVADNPYSCSFPLASSPPGIYPYGCTTADAGQTNMSLVLPDPVFNGNQTGVVTAMHVLSAATAPAQFVVVAWAGTPQVIEPPFPSAVTAVSEQFTLHPGLNNFNTNLPVEFQLHDNGFETWSIVCLNILDGSSPLPAQLGGAFSTTGLLFDNGRPLTQTAVDLTIPPHNTAISGFPPMTLLMSGDVTITTGGGGGPPGGGGGGAVDLAAPEALVRKARAIVDLVCAAGGPCPGDVRLQNQPAVGGQLTAGAAAPLVRRAKVVTYGKASFNLAAGQTAMVPVKLKPAGRKIARGHRTPTVWANITISGAAQPISRQLTLVH